MSVLQDKDFQTTVRALTKEINSLKGGAGGTPFEVLTMGEYESKVNSNELDANKFYLIKDDD